jgi:hypothetical protein
MPRGALFIFITDPAMSFPGEETRHVERLLTLASLPCFALHVGPSHRVTLCEGENWSDAKTISESEREDLQEFSSILILQIHALSIS